MPELQPPADSARAVLARELDTFYAEQAHLIDSGRHRAWAETFTADGEFHSPTYAEPAVGHEALGRVSQAFAASAAAENETHRHVITNLAVVSSDEGTVRSRAYLMVVASGPHGVRIARIVTVQDELVRPDGRWQVCHRRVTTDQTS